MVMTGNCVKADVFSSSKFLFGTKKCIPHPQDFLVVIVLHLYETFAHSFLVALHFETAPSRPDFPSQKNVLPQFV
jgi:hypothetical protein